MRCLICDFNEHEPLSGLGLARGFLPDGSKNYMFIPGEICKACWDGCHDDNKNTDTEVDEVYEEDLNPY